MARFIEVELDEGCEFVNVDHIVSVEFKPVFNENKDADDEFCYIYMANGYRIETVTGYCEVRDAIKAATETANGKGV